MRRSQFNGEDLRDRWHSALRNTNEGIEIDPDSVKIKVRASKSSVEAFADMENLEPLAVRV